MEVISSQPGGSCASLLFGPWFMGPIVAARQRQEPEISRSRAGCLAFLAVAVPLGLPRQYWRFAGLPDQVAVVGASLGTAALFWAGLHAFGGWRPPNLAFPAVHAAALVTLLGGARAIGRL